MRSSSESPGNGCALALPSNDQVVAPCAQAALELRIGLAANARRPVRVVSLLEQAAAIDRHEAARVSDARRDSADIRCSSPRRSSNCSGWSSRSTWPDHEIAERPRIEPVQRQIEDPLERQEDSQSRQRRRIRSTRSPAPSTAGNSRCRSRPGCAWRRCAADAPEGRRPTRDTGTRWSPTAGALILDTQGGAAMAAGIVESVQRAGLIPHQQQTLIADLEGAECPRAAQARSTGRRRSSSDTRCVAARVHSAAHRNTHRPRGPPSIR